jgi:hypothetical protein
MQEKESYAETKQQAVCMGELDHLRGDFDTARFGSRI